MSIRIDLPPAAAAKDPAALYNYMARTVPKINYALSFLDVPEETGDAGIRAEDPNNKSTKISQNSTNTQYPTSKAVYDYAVPQTRQVNGKALSGDVTLAAADVGAVPTDRKINEHALSSDLTLAPADLGEADYITETGSNNNGWSWVKWHSGICEMWAKTLTVSMSAWTDWTTDLKYATATISFPFSFADVNEMSIQVTLADRDGVDTEVNGLLLIARKTARNTRIRLVRKTAAGAARVDVYVRGTIATASPIVGTAQADSAVLTS